MGWFRKTEVRAPAFTACGECGVHFSPVGGLYGHLCPTHRALQKERDARRHLVLRWAEARVDQLYDQAKAELVVVDQACLKFTGQMNSQYSQPLGAAMRNPFSL